MIRSSSLSFGTFADITLGGDIETEPGTLDMQHLYIHTSQLRSLSPIPMLRFLPIGKGPAVLLQPAGWL